MTINNINRLQGYKDKDKDKDTRTRKNKGPFLIVKNTRTLYL